MRHAKFAGICTEDPLPVQEFAAQMINHSAKKIKTPKALLRFGISSKNFAISIRDFDPPPPEATVYISDQIAPKHMLKTNQREAYDLAYKQAQEHNAFEGLLLNKDGCLVDGSRSSLFVLKDTTMIILKGGIEGITRQQAALQARKLGFEVKRAYLRPDQIDGQLFLAGTGVGLVPVSLIETHISDL